jgi:hypothetical protein
MLALASAVQGHYLTPIVILVAAVIVAFFWQPILRIGIAALVIGLLFLLATGTIDLIHALHALLP